MNESTKIARYLLSAVFIGGIWFLNRDKPAWEAALSAVIVFAILMIMTSLALRRRGTPRCRAWPLPPSA